MNVRESIIYCESIERENKARECWMGTHGKEMGLDKKKKRKEQREKEKSPKPPPKAPEPEDEEPEETRPLSLVYNQERYGIKYDLAAWGDLAVKSGYNKFNFRV